MKPFNAISKKNSGLLAKYDNPLAKTGYLQESSANKDEVERSFHSTHDALKKLFEQANNLQKSHLVQSVVDLLQARLEIDHIWIASFGDQQDGMMILGSRSKDGSAYTGAFPLSENSPLKNINAGNYICSPRNAMIQFANDPYLLKYNINGVIALPICDSDQEVLGLIVAMDSVAIEHSEKICTLLNKTADALSGWIGSNN